jgi:hypothetical protein
MRDIRDPALRRAVKIIAEKHEGRAEGLINGNFASFAEAKESAGYLRGLRDAIEFIEAVDIELHALPSAGKEDLSDE